MSATLAAFFALSSGYAKTAPPAAGQTITNQATASYLNEKIGTFEIVSSNTVSLEVLPVPSIEVVGEQRLRLAPVSQGQYLFRATNTGNVPLDVKFDMSELAGDDFDVAGDLYLDANGSGALDPGETIVEPTDLTSLGLGESVSLVFRFDTPSGLDTDFESRSQLATLAKPVGDSDFDLTATNVSSTVISKAVLTLVKSAAFRADEREIDYRISVRNNSQSEIAPYAEIDEKSITVDGVQRTTVLVRDSIPLNTEFASVNPPGSFDAVYHRRGDSEHDYLSAPPASLDDVDAIAFLHDGAYVVGRSSDLEFTVSVLESASNVDIVNQAIAYSPSGASVRSLSSNEVVTPIEGPGNSIEFRDGGGDEVISTTPFDRNVTVFVNAANCNSSGEIDQIEVILNMAQSGDVEKLTARETGPNTGIFRTVPIGVLRVTTPNKFNNVIEGIPGDTAGATATAVCLGETVSTNLAVQSGGFVFDSVTNEPVSEAVVFIRHTSAAPSLSTFASASTASAPVSSTVTDETGYFDLGPMTEGTYEIVVDPPEVYTYPSVRTNFVGFERRVDDTISYGDAFWMKAGAMSGVDIPLDPSAALPMSLEKSADRSTVRRGGYVVYTLTARNTLNQSLLEARIEDQFPPGFLLVDGSARLDGSPLSSAPTVDSDGIVTFSLGRFPPLGEVEIKYTARVGATVGQGNRTNTAILKGVQAGLGVAYESTTARSTVRVDDRGGVFADEAVVIGRVFLDKDGDGIQKGEEEPGVPGVKIVTSTGLAVVTDADGRYSLYGLRPITHTFALMRSTLPTDAEPMLSEVDDVRSPGSRLIDLKRGELRGEDFPLEWSEAAADAVAIRIERFRKIERNAAEFDDLPLPFDSDRNLSSRSEVGVDTSTELLRGKESEVSKSKPVTEEKKKKSFNAEEQIANLTPDLGFIGIENESVIEHGTMDIRVKSPAEAILRLEVNGKVVPESQIGAKVIDRDNGVQLFQYVAVRLDPEENQLAIIAADPFGNDRERKEVTVFAPGKPTSIEIVAPRLATANGLARIPIVVRVLDNEGRRVNIPAEVTLTSENGSWDVTDIRDSIPGLQAYLDNGEATFDFIPPDLVGGEIIGVDAGFASAETEIAFTPDLSERVFVGVIEGAVAFGEDGADLKGLMESDEISGFEETTEGVRGQLYLKGKILGDALLTLKYDSDRDTNERLFRDIQRDEYYAVYGDQSEHGFDAQSSSSIYVKVEREQSYLLYGDLAIEPQADAIRLGAYRRSLTGGRAHYEEGAVSVDLFVAEADSEQRIVELRGRGVSGPYDFDLAGIVDGTEIVEILVRDRDQPNVILSTESQDRFSDYTLDFFRGTLIFNRPVPQLDDNLNPVSIRVTYETEEGRGDRYFVYGGELRVEPMDGLAFGYREVRSDADKSSSDHRTVRAAYAEADFEEYGKLQVEVAQTKNNLGDSGTGWRTTYKLASEGTIVSVDAARTSVDFDAPNSSVSAGREEARIAVEQVVNDRLVVGGEALYTREIATGDRRIGAELHALYAATPTLDVLGGLRAVDTDRESGDSEVLAGIAGLAWRPSYVPGATLRAEFEQDFLEGQYWRLLLGGDYQFNPKLRFYALNEISTAESGFFGLGDGESTNFTTKVGAEYQINEAVSGFSEYRESGSAGLDGGAATGLRGEWQVSEVLMFRASAEHVEPIDDGDDRSSSVALGAAYENDDTGVTLRGDVEWDSDEQGSSYFSNVAASYSLNRDFTVLGRNRFALDRRGDDRVRDRLRVGLAWRPEHDSRIKALGLYEFEYDDEDDETEIAHRWSVGAAYAPTSDFRTNLRYAGEKSSFRGVGFRDSTTLHMLRGGIEFDFAKDRFSLGGNAMLFTDDRGDSMTTGVGAEVKVNIAENVQLGLGYNHIDIEEDRLRDLYQSGMYLRLRLKLDESIWDEFDRTGLSGGSKD